MCRLTRQAEHYQIGQKHLGTGSDEWWYSRLSTLFASCRVPATLYAQHLSSEQHVS